MGAIKKSIKTVFRRVIDPKHILNSNYEKEGYEEGARLAQMGESKNYRGGFLKHFDMLNFLFRLEDAQATYNRGLNQGYHDTLFKTTAPPVQTVSQNTTQVTHTQGNSQTPIVNQQKGNAMTEEQSLQLQINICADLINGIEYWQQLNAQAIQHLEDAIHRASGSFSEYKTTMHTHWNLFKDAVDKSNALLSRQKDRVTEQGNITWENAKVEGINLTAQKMDNGLMSDIKRKIRPNHYA